MVDRPWKQSPGLRSMSNKGLVLVWEEHLNGGSIWVNEGLKCEVKDGGGLVSVR